MLKKTTLSFCLMIWCTYIGSAQQQLTWIDFEQLEEAFSQQPKRIIIDFYADWCVYCKKMDRVTFRDSKIVSKLASQYYTVKMNVETTDTIPFGGQVYTNQQFGKKRNPIHSIPIHLASRKEAPFTLPAIVILNEKFEIVARYFEYLSPAQLYAILEE